MPSLLEFLTWQDPRILLVPGQKLRVLDSYQSPLLKKFIVLQRVELMFVQYQILAQSLTIK
jgi:hypothetical protein